MTVINEGATRVRMSRIVDREGSEISQNIPGRYVFPGVRKELRVPAESLSCGASLMPLRVDTDGVMTEFNAACAN
jgi:hypothetical protein